MTTDLPSLATVLGTRPYPGRACLAGRAGDGTPFWAYALTGRTTASRARVLVESPRGEVEVRDARDDGEPDSLRHYVALARRGDWFVVGNGDHVVPLRKDLAAGTDLGDAFAVPSFEPDPPIHTPRIWLGVRTGSDATYLGWARRAADGHAHRGLVSVAGFDAGFGVLLTTYEGTAVDVRTSAAPTDIRVQAHDIGELEREVWDALPADLRVGGLVLSPHRLRLLSGLA